MKALAPIFLIALASCAPKAIVLEDASAPGYFDQPTAAPANNSAVASRAAAPSSNAGRTASTPAPSRGGGNSVGLLEPTNLLGLPTDQDMKSSVESGKPGRSTVIASPPSNDE